MVIYTHSGGVYLLNLVVPWNLAGVGVEPTITGVWTQYATAAPSRNLEIELCHRSRPKVLLSPHGMTCAWCSHWFHMQTVFLSFSFYLKTCCIHCLSSFQVVTVASAALASPCLKGKYLTVRSHCGLPWNWKCQRFRPWANDFLQGWLARDLFHCGSLGFTLSPCHHEQSLSKSRLS